jgi:hypothetical protein
MKKHALVIIAILLLLPAGAARAQDSSLAEAASLLAGEMDFQLAQLFGHQPGNAGGISVIVTTPVDINNFEESSAVARQMQESISHWLVRSGYSVQEARKGRALLFRPDTGELLLTRERDLAANTIVNSALTMVGNYTVTSRSVIFNLRMMRTSGTEVYAMSSLSIPLTGEIRTMLNQTTAPGGGSAYISIEPSVYNRLP